jgi:hypothetical protein
MECPSLTKCNFSLTSDVPKPKIHIAGSFKYLEVNHKDQLSVVDSDGTGKFSSSLTSPIWQFPKENMLSLSSSGKGYVCGISTTHSFMCLYGGTERQWREVIRSVEQVAIDHDTTCFAPLGDGGIVCSPTRKFEKWYTIAHSKYLEFVTVSGTSLCALDHENHILCTRNWKAKKQVWESVSGRLFSLTLSGNTLCGTNSKYEVFCKLNWQTSSDWINLPEKASLVSLNDNGILCGIGLSKDIWCQPELPELVEHLLRPVPPPPPTPAPTPAKRGFNPWAG